MNDRMTVMLLAAMSLLTMPLIAGHDGDKKTEREFRAELKGRNESPADAFRGTRDTRIDRQ